MESEDGLGPASDGVRRLAGVFLVALRLGLTSFGGPIAHIGYFRQEYVATRGWLDERVFADLVALCHFLPGPTSSQLGFAVGVARAGLGGGIAAWLGFTLPSAVLMAALGIGVGALDSGLESGYLRGLLAVAAAVVALALWGMARQLAPDWTRGAVACVAFFASFALPQPVGLVALLIVAGGFGVAFLGRGAVPSEDSAAPERVVAVSSRVAMGAMILVIVMVGGGVIAAALTDAGGWQMLSGFLTSGALVFGGGHVVLGLLEEQVVQPGFITSEQFLAGYGAAQAVPGPLFTFAAYLGAVAEGPLSGPVGAVLALLAIFVPSLLLVVAVLPYWHGLRSNRTARAALTGVNAAVVGFLAHAMYQHVWLEGIETATDALIAISALVLLGFAKFPPWLVVILGGAAGYLLGLV